MKMIIQTILVLGAILLQMISLKAEKFEEVKVKIGIKKEVVLKEVDIEDGHILFDKSNQNQYLMMHLGIRNEGLQKISLDTVSSIRTLKERYTGTGALSGMLAGGLTFMYLSWNDNSSSGAEDFLKRLAFLLISGTGAGLGAIIGYNITDWQEIDLSKYGKQNISFNFMPTYNPSSNNIGLSLSVSF